MKDPINKNSINTSRGIEASDFGLTFCPADELKKIKVLRNINLNIEPGEIITIIGPSGCGKTTLLRSVAGLLEEKDDNVALDGSLLVNGRIPSDAKKERMFAFTFQNPVLLPWRSVKQNVSLPLEIVHDSLEESESVVDEMLSMVGINDFAKAMPTTISGGMQQRVNLARALVQKPKILLMDEPFGSLDEVTRERLNFELLRIQRSKNQTILFVTHSISEAVLLADRLIILSKRPSTVRRIVKIDLPRERTESVVVSSDYLKMVRYVRDLFAKEEEAKL